MRETSLNAVRRTSRTWWDDLRLSPVVLVGWSLGVREVLTYVQLFGTSTLRGLVLVDGEVWTIPTAEKYQQRAEFIHNLEADRAATLSGRGVN